MQRSHTTVVTWLCSMQPPFVNFVNSPPATRTCTSSRSFLLSPEFYSFLPLSTAFCADHWTHCLTQHFCLFPNALFLFGPVFKLFRPVVIRKGIISGKLFLTKMTRVRMMRMMMVRMMMRMMRFTRALQDEWPALPPHALPLSSSHAFDQIYCKCATNTFIANVQKIYCKCWPNISIKYHWGRVCRLYTVVVQFIFILLQLCSGSG